MLNSCAVAHSVRGISKVMSSLHRQSNGGCHVGGVEFSRQSSAADTPYSGTNLPAYLPMLVCYPRSIIIIIIIIIISFMQGIYTYIPETNYVPREYSVAAILLLLFMVLISLVSVLNLLYFYISTFRSMCGVHIWLFSVVP